MEASPLDSGMQELLETEEVGAHALTSDMRFHSQRLGAEAVRQELHILQILVR